MKLKWLYKTSFKYSCDLKAVNLKTFCEEWFGEDSHLLRVANQTLFVTKVIHDNQVILKRLGQKDYLSPNIKMTYFPEFKTVDFTITTKKRSFTNLLIPFAIFVVISLFTQSFYDLLLFLNDAKYIILGGLVFYGLILLYSLYEEKELTKKDFEQELYYQRIKYEEM